MISFDDMLRKFREGYQYCYLCEIEECENHPEGVQGGTYENRLLIAYYLDGKFTNPINVAPVLKRTIYGNRKMYVWKFAFTQEILAKFFAKQMPFCRAGLDRPVSTIWASRAFSPA